MTEENKSNRGGAREGSGRPHMGERKLVTVRLHANYYKTLVEESKAEGISQSKYVENLIDIKHGITPKQQNMNIRLIRCVNNGANSRMYFHFVNGKTAVRTVSGKDAVRVNVEKESCYEEMWEKYHKPQHIERTQLTHEDEEEGLRRAYEAMDVPTPPDGKPFIDF